MSTPHSNQPTFTHPPLLALLTPWALDRCSSRATKKGIILITSTHPVGNFINIHTDLSTFEGGPKPYLSVSDQKGRCFMEIVFDIGVLPLSSVKCILLDLGFQRLAGASNLISAQFDGLILTAQLLN